MAVKKRLRKFARDIGIGRLLMRYVHAPRHLRNEIAIVGKERYDRILRRREEMKRAVAALAPLAKPPADAPEVTFLTGSKFWHETILCAATLRATSSVPLRLHLVDDGTLVAQAMATITYILPGTRYSMAEEVEARLDKCLPKSRFRKLRHTRTFYPHIKKLIDVHAGTEPGWKVVLDSDMLFWREPVQFLDWLRGPSKPLLMVDAKTAYGYPDDFLEELACGPLPQRVNVGITGLHSGELDWEWLEWIVAQLLDRVGRNYYMEQAIIAALVREREVEYLHEADYRCYPSPDEMKTPTNILQHYVAETKYTYHEALWEQALEFHQLAADRKNTQHD